jgi:25S rRNA (cytosine2278-C5)-methyltransferase
MSLYHDAVAVIASESQDGSLKSRIYSNKLQLKSKPAHIYALVSETVKYDQVLKEIIENAGILSHESKVRELRRLLSRVSAD